jgi:hypothetical protein
VLGNGLFTVSEAALYARVSPQMMARWLFGSKKGQSVVHPQFGSEGRFVSFLDLVQTLAIREIRMQKNVPLPKFRQAIRVAKEKFDLDYPFARQHCTYLFGDELVIAPPGEGFVEASGKHRGQRLFSFVEMYLKDLSFNPAGLANRYRIYTRDKVPIVMRPDMRFGEPLLPSGYSARSIWESLQTEGSIPRTAEVNGISVAEVEATYRFLVTYLGKSAA